MDIGLEDALRQLKEREMEFNANIARIKEKTPAPREFSLLRRYEEQLRVVSTLIKYIERQLNDK
jgi:hypothetical protein